MLLHDIRYAVPQPLAQQRLCGRRHRLPRPRDRPQHDDLQHRRRRAAEAVSRTKIPIGSSSSARREPKEGDEVGRVGARPARLEGRRRRRSRRSPASSGRSLTVTDGAGEPERYQGARISWDLFRLLGTQSDSRPRLPRERRSAECRRRRRCSATCCGRRGIDPIRRCIGRSIHIDGRPHTVVGVMPPNFAFPENQRLWVPLQPTLFKDPRDLRYLFTFGRLAPGVSQERALERSQHHRRAPRARVPHDQRRLERARQDAA